MTIQPFYTHSERYAAQGVYNQLKDKEPIVGLSPHEIGEKEILRQRLNMPVGGKSEEAQQTGKSFDFPHACDTDGLFKERDNISFFDLML